MKVWLLALTACAAGAQAQQQCDAAGPPSMPETRFEDHGDGSLSDRRSGLMWLRCSVGQRWTQGACAGEAARLAWPQALAAAQGINDQGSHFFKDWRVPQLHELAQLTEHRCRHPRTNLAVLPGTAPGWYWTATRRAGEPGNPGRWALSFDADGVSLEDPAQPLHLRLVRTGP